MTNPPACKVLAKMTEQPRPRLGVHERLALIGLMEEGLRVGVSESPLVADLFDELGELVNATVSGAKVDRLKSDGANGFKVFEINARFGGGYPLAHRAGAPFSRWLLEEAAGRPGSAHNDWEEGVTMLRYDAAMFVPPGPK